VKIVKRDEKEDKNKETHEKQAKKNHECHDIKPNRASESETLLTNTE
jgi:hypothetical protein